MRRIGWLVAAVAIAFALRLARSQASFAALGIVAPTTLTWFVVSRWTPRAKAALLTVVLLAGVVAGVARVRTLERDPDYRGASMRQQFNAASLRVIEQRPLTGIGVGQYLRSSALFLPAWLAYEYGFENAHNNFLQIGAELGVPGLTIVVLLLACVAVRAARAVRRAPRDPRLLGVAASVAGFLGTCLSGHPLLIDETAVPFWCAFGLLLALSESVIRDAAPTEIAAKTERATAPALPWLAATAAIGVAAVSVIAATAPPVEPQTGTAFDGFYPWESGPEGRYRWTSQYGSLFVTADVTRVEIPVRLPVALPAMDPMGVTARVGGVDRQRTFVSDRWVDLVVTLPDVSPTTRYKRIDLRTDWTWQPALHIAGNADMRVVGIQVGEVKLFQR
jgi:hypothetical protein